jgi:tight adherence protein C
MFFTAFISFLATVFILMVLVYFTSPQAVDIGRRLSRTLKGPGAANEPEKSTADAFLPQNVVVSIGKMMPATKGKKLSQDQLVLTRAGYRDANAHYAIKGARLICMVSLFLLVMWTGWYEINPVAVPVMAAGLGWFAPEMWLLTRVKARQKRLRLGLPDAMDLMVICVEVGLGMDQALMRVAEELEIVHPELSAELSMVNLEMRVGKTRLDALRELATRTGLDDIKALVGILVQTDRFGTSIVSALRTFSDELRTKRRQRAEELSAKVSVKMVPALVFFIFPALMVVILGPAVILIMKSLLPALK